VLSGIAFCLKNGTLLIWFAAHTSLFFDMLSESIGLLGVATLYGGIAIAVTVLLIATLGFCVKLLLQLRQATAACEELTAANCEMKAAIKAKGEFLVDMSHTIRTPMNALISFTEILIQRVTQNCSSEFKEESEGILDIIKKNSHDLLTTINDVLDYIKIDANMLEIESVPMSIKQVIHDVCHVEKQKVIAKNLDLSIKYNGDIPPHILCDPLRIRQILAHLISNAIKFTGKGTISVVCEALKDDASESTIVRRAVSMKEFEKPFAASLTRLKISVTDTGVGILPAQARELFKPFKLADSSVPQANKGAGLGLSIAMRLATLLDGTIEFESVPGQGSTFSLLLNVYVPQGTPEALMERSGNSPSRHGSQLLSGLDIRIPDQSESALPDKRQPLRNVRILVVEDMVVNQVIISTLLREVGAQVEIADNGAIGVQKVMHDMDNGLVFDVILMDMQMPVMDGYEATAFLRKHNYDRPIVAVTAHALTGDREKTLKAGCDDYIAKPIDNHTLIEIVQKYVSA